MSCLPVATQAEAEAGIANDKAMTPLRTKEAIDALGVSRDELISPVGGQMVGFLQSGAGAVPRNMLAKTREIVSVADFGAVGDGVTDDSDALAAAFAHMAATGRVNLLSGRYKVTKPLTIPPGAIEGGEVIFDFSDADPSDFGDAVEYSCIRVKGGARTRIANLSTDLVIGNRQMEFAAAHGLSAGDTFNISGIVNYAGNGWRDYYTKGEMFRVAKVVDATTIVTEGACRDTYVAADVEIWKRSGDSFTQGCAKLTVIGPDTILYPIYFQRLDRVSVDNMRADGGSVTALGFDDCFGVTGTGVYARQVSDAFDGYGIGVFNCQDVRIWGSAHGRFNGFVVGGGLTAGGRVGMNRDIHFEGIGASDPVTGLSGANLHGNAEYCSLKGVFYNGVTLAGNWNEAHGTFISTHSSSAVLFAEMHGHSFKVSGEVVITSGNDLPDNVGAIHMTEFANTPPGVTGPSTARYGGVTDLDIVFRAPKATRMIIWRPLELARTDVAIRLGLDVLEAHPTTRIIATYSQGSGNEWPLLQFTRLNIIDNAIPIYWSIADSTKIRGLRRSKTVAVTGTGTSATAAVTFDPAFPRTPAYNVTLNSDVILGATLQVPGFVSPTASGGVIRLAAVNGMSQTFNANVTVTASLDEE